MPRFNVFSLDELAETDEDRKLLQERYAKNPDLRNYFAVQDTESGATKLRHKKEVGGIETFLKNALVELPASGAGMLAGGAVLAGGAAPAVAGAAPTGGGSALALGAGSLAAALAAAGLTSYGVNKGVEKFLPETAEDLALSARARPYVTTAGRLASGFPFAANAPRALINTARARALSGGKSTLSELSKLTAPAAAVGAGLEAGSELALEGDIDPSRVAMTGLTAPLQVTPTKLGEQVERLAGGIAGKLRPKVGGKPPILDRTMLYRKVVEAADKGITDPNVYNTLAKELDAEGVSPEKLIETSRKMFTKEATMAEKTAAKEMKAEAGKEPERLALYHSLLKKANEADEIAANIAKELEKVPKTDADLLTRTQQSLAQAQANAAAQRKAALEAMNEYYKNVPNPSREVGFRDLEGVWLGSAPDQPHGTEPVVIDVEPTINPAERFLQPPTQPRALLPESTPSTQAKGFLEQMNQGQEPFIRYSGVDPSAVRRAAEWFAPGIKSINVKELLARRGRIGDPFSAVAVNHLQFTRPFGIEENKAGEIPTAGLVNKMDSLVPKTEMEYYKRAGLEEFLGSKKGIKAGDLAAWLADRAPRVEVVKIAPESADPTARRKAELRHELETRGYAISDDERAVYKFGSPDETFTGRDAELIQEFKALPDSARSAKDATIGKYGVEPRPVEKLVDPVEILVKVPFDENSTYNRITGLRPKWTGGHHGKSGYNAIGFVRGNTEVLPDGKKVFHIFENQTDWGAIKKEDRGPHAGEFRTSDGAYHKSYNDAVRHNFNREPLLGDWQRTTLKAAIKHAVDTGHDYIALSDAETAMLTEGHDAYAGQLLGNRRITNEAAERLRKDRNYQLTDEDFNVRPEQEDGMRLHYDQVAPRLLSDLTGVSPERVSFGEHWKTRRIQDDDDLRLVGDPVDTATGIPYKYRDNLIFKNPDGTPKTDISARAYSLEKIKQAANEGLNFTLTGNDKSYYSGIPPHLVSQIARLGLKLPDVFVKFLYEGNTRFGGTKPVNERLKELGKDGEYLANKTWDLDIDAKKNFRAAAIEYNNAFEGASNAEINRVHAYMKDMFDFGTSAVELTPNEQRIYTGVRNGLTRLAEMQLLQGGPLVEDRHMFRERGINPDYLPQMVKRDVYNTLNKKTVGDPEYDRLVADWIAHQQFKLGNTPEEALANFMEFRSSLKTIDPSKMAEYGPVTKAEGIGLPDSWRAGLPDTLYYHAMRASRNLSWFKNIQSDPVASKIIGNQLDGKGGKIDLTAPELAGVQNLSDKESVQHWLAEQNLHKTYRPDAMDRWTSLVNSLMIGPKSAIRDFLSTPGHLAELVPAEEAGKFIEAAKNLLTSDVRGRAEKAGAISAHRPLEFFLQYDPADSMGRITEAIRKLSGRNLIEGGARQFAFELGRLVGQARALKGDYGFFDHLGIKNWKELNSDQLGDAVGNRFVQQSQGQYSLAGLPYYLLNSSDRQLMKSMMNLQRWGVERFNNWYRNAWRPAVDEGRLAPLLKSVLGNLAGAGVLRWIEEELFNQKPPEMTWREFLNADNKEVAYTLFSKLQTAGFAGILSDLSMAGIKMYHGEQPMPIENSGWSALGGLVARIGQGVGAVGTGKQSVGDMLGTLASTIATDNIQIAKLIRAANRAETGNREERIYKRQMGLSSPGMPMLNNPFDDTRKMRDVDTLAEVQSQIGNVTEYISNTGLVPMFRTPVRQVKREDGRPNFYSWLSKLQGDAAAEKQFAYDQSQAALVEVKRAAVDEARRRVYQSSAP